MDFFDAAVEIGKASTPEEMRAEIYRLRQDDPMVRDILMSADFHGLSAEDRYTQLAYYALVEYGRLRAMLLRQLSISPATNNILTKGRQDEE